MEWLEIFDISLFRSLIRSATPIALIGFGAAMCSASGVLNIGLEGKMLNAAFVGIAASYYSGSALTGFIWGVSAGVLTAILFGFLSFNLGADEVLVGLAINIFSIAGTRYLLETLFKRRGFFSDPSIQGIDPITFDNSSLIGIPGLFDSYKSGNVNICSAPGSGIADDKAIYTYLPDIIKFYLGEEPLLENVKTWRCYKDDKKNMYLTI